MDIHIKKKFFIVKGEKVILVPYLLNYIEKYHEWMQDPEILDLTASEPLTLEEEIQNQRSWLLDPLKYTFLICENNDEIEEFLKKQENLNGEINDKQIEKDNSLKFRKIHGTNNSEFTKFLKNLQPCGDINLFFHEYMDEDECEIDVMIGNKNARGKGLAKESVILMRKFGEHIYKKKRFVAKIKEKNETSIQLFQKLKFQKIKIVKVFDEIHFEYKVEKEEQFEINMWDVSEIISI